MADRDNRAQTDKIAELLGCDFGVADAKGHVIYSGTNTLPEGAIITVPDGSEDFACQNDDLPTYFLRHNIDNAPVWFFMKDSIDAEMAKRLLDVACYAYDTHGESQKKKRREFLRTLLLSGYTQVNADELNQYCMERPAAFDVEGYAVLLTTVNSGNQAELGTVEEFIEGIFPSAEGYITLSTDTEKVCTICPIGGENTLDALESTAMLVKDTVLSELMMNVDVSLGVQVAGLKQIDYAFKTADRAELIGKTFEVPAKCFVYDKLGLFRIIYGQPKENCIAYLREVFGRQIVDEVLNGKAKSNSADEILKTIETFLQLDQNISETSKAMFIHRNTLIYRLDKFSKQTGLDITRFEDGMKVGMALVIMKYYNKRFD